VDPTLRALNLRRLERDHGRRQRGVDEDDITTSVVLVSLVSLVTFTFTVSSSPA
jgi:hypothetical protein